MEKRQAKTNCPTCRKVVPWSEASLWRPFCSERCRLIDLGEWLEEGHRISGDPEKSAPFPQSDE